MTKEQLNYVIQFIIACEQIFRMQFRYINITGGEPLVHKDFYWFLQKLRQELPELKVSLITNGTIEIDKNQVPKDIFEQIRISNDIFHRMERERLGLIIQNYIGVAEHINLYNSGSNRTFSTKGRGINVFNKYQTVYHKKFCYTNQTKSNQISFSPNNILTCSENSVCYNEYNFLKYKDFDMNNRDDVIRLCQTSDHNHYFHQDMNCTTPCTYFALNLDENGNLKLKDQ